MNPVISRFALEIEQVDGFEFRVRFDKPDYAELRMDEPAPLGRDSAPNPARILAAAIGDCLSASLLFCTRRAGVAVLGMRAEVEVEIVRNENKRLRVGRVGVRLHPKLAEDAAAFASCMDMFEDFCVVTQSVRDGLKVDVEVEPELVA